MVFQLLLVLIRVEGGYNVVTLEQSIGEKHILHLCDVLAILDNASWLAVLHSFVTHLLRSTSSPAGLVLVGAIYTGPNHPEIHFVLVLSIHHNHHNFAIRGVLVPFPQHRLHDDTCT